MESIYHGGCLERLAAAVPCGVVLVRDGCVAWANQRLAELAGREGPLVGAKLGDLLCDSGDGLPDSEGPDELECALPRPGGALTVLCRRAWPESSAEPAAWVLEDVSRLRVLERELLRAGQELSLANREMEGLREHLRAERAEREELLTVVSHELRTPLTVIGGYNRLLLSEEVGPLTDDQRRFLEESSRSCRRLDGFIANLLEASRAAKGDDVLELGRGDLVPLIESLAAMFEPILVEGGISLTLDLDASARFARFDPLRVERILTNLLGNAVRYAGRGGHIWLATRPASDPGAGAQRRPSPGRHFVEVSIADDGPGVDPEDRERIFRPFVQAGENSRAGGLGLGLAICRRLAEAHGGAIEVASRPGGGARFAFTLPVEP
jgi:signal transduction histidine kinase